MTSRWTAFVVLCGMLIVPPAIRAQYLWTVTHTDFDGRNYYCFDALDCSGDVCTAAGLKIDTVTHQVFTVLYRSTDDGASWSEQGTTLRVHTRVSDEGKNTFVSVRQVSAATAFASGTYQDFGRDTTLLLRTTDGGQSWVRLAFQREGDIVDADFADSLNGILLYERYSGNCLGCVAPIVFTTNDGGMHWDSTGVAGNKCHAFGNGRFSVLAGWHGSIVSTGDNWKTSLVSADAVDSADDPQNYVSLRSVSVAGPDTILVFGRKNYINDWSNTEGVLLRSTDGGKSWGPLQEFPSVNLIEQMSSLSRDTVLAGGMGTGHILMSTDHGATWRTDSLYLDTIYSAYSVRSLVFTGSGQPLAVYRFEYLYDGVPSIIVRGSISARDVKMKGSAVAEMAVFPNPTTGILTLHNVPDDLESISIVNVLGERVMGTQNLHGSDATIDVSSLSPGVYYARIVAAGSASTKMIVRE